MPTGSYLFDDTYVADEAIAAYRAVVYGATKGHVKLPAAQDANAIAGVSQHSSSASGDTLIVRKAGRSKIEVSSANVTAGIDLRIWDIRGMADRQVDSWASGDGVLGIAEEASAASGDIISCWLEIHTAH